jgi:hypothetical protein
VGGPATPQRRVVAAGRLEDQLIQQVHLIEALVGGDAGFSGAA